MKVRSSLVLASLLLGLMVAPAAADPPGDPEAPVVGGIYGRGVAGPGSYAVLIDVDSIEKAKPTAKANCSNDAPDSGIAAYTGWQIAGPVTAHLNRATVPSALGDVTSAMQSGFSAWQVDSSVPAVTVAGDGTVTRYTANRSYDILFGKTGNSLATTYTWRWNDGTVESDTVFNTSGVTWYRAIPTADGCDENAGNKYDVANIATHEFGHSYGLDHPANDRFETMYAYGYSGETLKRSPGTGDVLGITTIY